MTENDYKFFQEAILDQSLDLSLWQFHQLILFFEKNDKNFKRHEFIKPLLTETAKPTQSKTWLTKLTVVK